MLPLLLIFFCEILVMSEEELPPAESFSPILIEEYIRLMTAAHYIRSEDKSGNIQFKIAPDDFKAVQEYHIQAPLIGLTLQYNEDSGVLTVTGSEEFTQMYENKIQEEVALNFEIDFALLTIFKFKIANLVSCTL